MNADALPLASYPPRETALLLALIERERELSALLCERDPDVEDHELGGLSVEDSILDFIGVPPDATVGLSQKELGDGTCRHGIEYYCRDWSTAWLSGDSTELATAEEFLHVCRVHAAEHAKGRWVCVQCAGIAQ